MSDGMMEQPPYLMKRDPEPFLAEDFEKEMIEIAPKGFGKQRKFAPDYGNEPVRVKIWNSLDTLYTKDKTVFDPYLVFLFGPNTNSMVLSFFFSNPIQGFSKEDVFAHLNKHDDESGIGSYFFDHIGFSSGIDNKRGIKIGRNTVARAIDNLVENETVLKVAISESIKKSKRYKYCLNLEDDINLALKKVANEIARSEKYKNFESFRQERMERRGDSVYPSGYNLCDVIDDYLRDIFMWDKNSGKPFSFFYKKKETRLVDYCESKNLNWSTTNRSWSEYIKPRSDIQTSILWEHTLNNLWIICCKLNSTLPNKPNCTKEEMIDIIVKNTI